MSRTKNPPPAHNPVNTIHLDIHEHKQGVTFPVVVQPRSNNNSIAGIRDGALKVKVTAPPVEGAANEALIKLLSRTFSIKKSDIEILRMKTSPCKLIQCRGLSRGELESFLNNIISKGDL